MPDTLINGVTLHWRSQCEGVPVVFIHGGFGGVSTSVDPAPATPLEWAPPGVEVTAYDRRCAGRSEYVLDWFTLAELAADCLGLMQMRGHERFIVVGSSMGGMIAQQVALTHPDAVMALGLMNTGPDLMANTHWGRSYVTTAARVKDSGDDVEFARVRERIRNPGSGAAPGYIDKLAALSDDELKRMHSGTVRNYGAFAGFEFAARLGEIKVPTLIVHGNADDVVPFADGQRLHAGVAGSEFVEIEGSGHGILINPQARAALHEWLSRQIG